MQVRKYNDQTAPDVVSARAVITDAAVNAVIAAQGSRQLMMDSLSIVNTSATDVYVDILSGAGNIIWSCAAPKSHGGSNMPFPKPIPGTGGQGLSAQVSGAVTSVIVSIGAHILPIANSP